MSDALINKYRPQAFKEIIGQDRVVESLENAIKKKLGTAYLLTGPSGTGKTTLARIAAKLLGCSPADLIEEDAAKNTGIENMREIIEQLMYRPLGEQAVRVVIIDEAHMLSKNAVISLLKSLEDPPSWVYWFLCTTDPNKIPKAVQTRCLTYQLKDVRQADLLKLLKNTEEGSELEEDVLEVCVEEAHGSPRQALSNLGVCLTAQDREEALDLMHSASEDPAAFDLAKALMQGADWGELRDIMAKLKEKEVSAESVRHVIRAYMTTVVLSPKSNGKSQQNALAILEQFSTPFNSFDGMTPLVMACARLAL